MRRDGSVPARARDRSGEFHTSICVSKLAAMWSRCDKVNDKVRSETSQVTGPLFPVECGLFLCDVQAAHKRLVQCTLCRSRQDFLWGLGGAAFGVRRIRMVRSIFQLCEAMTWGGGKISGCVVGVFFCDPGSHIRTRVLSCCPWVSLLLRISCLGRITR